MPAFPIPFFTASLLFFLGLKAWRERETAPSVLVVIFACAVQSLIISLHYHYGVEWLRSIQPVTALIIPPLTYIAYTSTSVRSLELKRDWLHVLPPVLALISLFWWPAAIDGLIILGFAGYGLAMLWQLRSGSDHLSLTRLGDDTRPLILWRLVAVSLIASAFSDALIVIAVAFGAEWLHPWVVSIYSTGIILAIGLLSLSDVLKPPSLNDVAEAPDTETEKPGKISETPEDQAIMAQLEEIMREKEVFLDPDLTLKKLSRQLLVPEKQISVAVNRVKSENLPRYINTYRINHACGLLEKGQSITAAIYASGFNTKSNFNREFLRVKGCAPSEWLAQQ